MADTLEQQVRDTINRVRKRADNVVSSLQSSFWGRLGTDGAEAAISAINTIRRGPLPRWERQGLDALKAGNAPGKNGWPGWVKAGNIILDGIEEIADDGRNETLASFVDANKAATKEAVETVERIAKKAASLPLEIAKTAGEAQSALIKPLIPVLIVVGLGAIAWALGPGGARGLVGK